MSESFVAAVTAAETADAFALYMGAKGWCIDVSQSRARLLNAPINQVACPEELDYQFHDWLDTKPPRVCNLDATFHTLLPKLMAQRLPRVYWTSFRPTNEATFLSQGALMANTYRPFTPAGNVCQSGVALLDELAARLWPIESERKVCLQFLAQMLRHPTERPQWGLLITGDGGCGKSVLIGLVEKALGNRATWRESSYTKAMGKFSEVLPNNLLVTFDDAKAGGDTLEQLKHAVTSEFQEVELKGVQQRRLREVYARLVILTNELQPFELSDDRRFFVPARCTHRVNKPESDDFFRRMRPWSDGPDCAATVRAWLGRVDLSDFDTVTPRMTDTHRAMSATSSNELADMIAAYVADERIVHVDEVAHHLAGLGHGKPSRHEIEKALAVANYAGRRRPHPKKKGQVELWGPARQRRGRALTPTELERMAAAGAFR